MTVVVRDAVLRDLDGIVDLHAKAFPANLTTQLGRAVVRHYYAQAFEPTSTMVLLTAEVDGSLAGFAAGLYSPRAFYSSYRRQRLTVLRLALRFLVRSPTNMRRVLAAYARAVDTVDWVAREAELASIAVAPQYRRLGAGAALVHALRGKLPPDVSAIYLWTDRDDNDVTLRFYERLGFGRREERAFDRRRTMVRLGLDLHSVRQAT
jgi:ribosomal protein S18 acetylase RimI-like enzyme